MTNNLRIDLENVTFLTSQCCEDTGQVSEQRLAESGLPVGQFMGSPYPLTDLEACYIGEDVINMAGYQALTGYSVLIGSQKYLAPTIELDYRVWDTEENPEIQSEKWAMDENTKLQPMLEKMASMTGGLYSWEDEAAVEFSNGDGRFVVTLFVPFEYAQKHANGFEQWKDHLSELANTAVG